MTAAELLPSLSTVRPRGASKWSARCPSHADKSPSLTITEGDKGLLLKCWAGCTLEEITKALGLSIPDLFYDRLADESQWRQSLERRTKERAARQVAYEAAGRRIDALREAEVLIQSACGISIEKWSDDRLNAALERLGAAYQLLESEAA